MEEKLEPTSDLPEKVNEEVAENKPKKKKTWLIILIVIIGILIIGGGTALGFGLYIYNQVKEEATKDNVVEEVIEQAEEVAIGQEVSSSNFGTWKDVKVEYSPQVPTYTVKKDLSDTLNPKLVEGFSDEAKNQLVENKFIVTPGYDEEFFTLYDANRYDYVPSFITTDSILHNYHLYFNYLLEKVETESLSEALNKLTDIMLAESMDQYKELKDTKWQQEAEKNVAYYSVAKKLLDPSYEPDEMVADVVAEELAMIDAAEELTVSPLWGAGYKEDYTQYKPRGHYDKSDELKQYFKAMMWYGRMTFRFKNDQELRQAVLITKAMQKSDIFKLWDKIYEPTNFFVGKSDDISFYEMKSLFDEVYGVSFTTNDLIDEEKFKSLKEKAADLEGPKLNSIPVLGVTAGGNEDLEEEIKGFRFMGQRYTIDADIFQNLICRQVGNLDGTMDCPKPGQSRMLPKNLDIPAAMGSEVALNILEDEGETKYEKYPEQMKNLKKYIADLDQGTWTQNLYWGWMYTLKPLLQQFGEGYPLFMQNRPWDRKELVTYLSSWTELKHDTILYAKQVYAELGGGPVEEIDDRGYVEPIPEVYARLSSLINLTNDGLSSRNLLDSKDKDNLKLFDELVVNLLEISEKELNNEPLTEKEYEVIKTYGGSLEHLWLETFSEEDKAEKSTEDLLNEYPAALVTDVATDPNGAVLEEAVGYINNIYVVFPVDGTLKILKGGVYSQYEFLVPLDQRMTDTEWRKKLENQENVPPVADWQKKFLIEDPYGLEVSE